MKLPYGLADFYRLVTQGFVYVDRTAHIRRLEELGEALVFLRPRRFGKSLWLSTLRSYYDLRTADEHQQLFGSLDAGRRPTASAHRYFVLHWNFSALGLGTALAEDVTTQLNGYVNNSVRTFVSDYREHLPDSVAIEDRALFSLGNLLAVIRRTPYRLYLLIDEYDNFANEIMMTDESAYKRLVHADGPFRQLMKWVKSAMEGQGLERLFLTGVTPVVLSDLTSGLNITKNVSLDEDFASLAGFTDQDALDLLERVADERRSAGKPLEFSVDEAHGVLRTWYDGYRFVPGTEPVYNPTLALYFLDHLLRHGTYPRQMLDVNLAADEDKLRYLSRAAAGRKVVIDVLRAGEPLEVGHLEDGFTLSQMMDRAGRDSSYLASFLYYFGMLTLAGETARRTLELVAPNLVVKKLYVGEVLRLLLPEEEDPAGARRPAWELSEKGDLEPLLDFVEQKLLPTFGRRDYLHMNELTLKTAFMTLLFDDVNYTMLSEPAVEGGYADLVLLLRPDARSSSLSDLVLEFKYVAPEELGKRRREVASLDRRELAKLPRVAGAIREAERQLERYRTGLRGRFGELRLRSYAVVALGFERLVGRETTSSDAHG